MDAVDERIKPLRRQVTEIEAPYNERLFEKKLDELPPYYRVAWETPAAERTEGQRLNARQVQALQKQIKREDITALMTKEEIARREELEIEIARLDATRPEKYATARTVTEGRPHSPALLLPASRRSRLQGVADGARRLDGGAHRGGDL